MALREPAPGSKHRARASLSPLSVQDRQFLYLVGAALLVNHYDLGIFSLALPQIQASLAIPESQLGLYVGVLRLGVLGAFFLGFAADIVGRRRILMATIVGTTVATALTAFVQDRYQYLALQTFVRGFAYAEEMLCFVMIVEAFAADRRGWALGRLSALGALGTGLAAAVYSQINSLPHGWRDLYLIGGVGLVMLVIARRGLAESRRFEAIATGSNAAERVDRLRPLIALVRDNPGRVAALIGTTAPYVFGMAAAIAFVSKHLQENLGLKPGQVSLLYLTAGAVSFFGYMMAGRLADLIGRRRMLVIAMPGAAALYGLLYLSSDVRIAIGTWILGLFLMFAAEMTLAMLGTELFPTSYRATAASARVVVTVIAGMAGLAAESVLYPLTGSHASAIGLLLCLTPLSLLPLFFIPETATRELEAIAPEPTLDPVTGEAAP